MSKTIPSWLKAKIDEEHLNASPYQVNQKEPSFDPNNDVGLWVLIEGQWV